MVVAGEDAADAIKVALGKHANVGYPLPGVTVSVEYESHHAAARPIVQQPQLPPQHKSITSQKPLEQTFSQQDSSHSVLNYATEKTSFPALPDPATPFLPPMPMSIICGILLLECVYSIVCARWAWKGCLHTTGHDSDTWGFAIVHAFFLIYCIDVTVLVMKLLIRLDVGFSNNALGKNTFIIYEANYCRKCGDDEKSDNARTQQSTIEMHDDDERGCNDEEVALELVND
ncbi:DNA-binding protein HEXBP [Tanacetum coccineum]|uniref:DNA-binding protein HEXBP n=1 Tax=Tanacetum coccineum TaxID=301880 RepID=A0ABQ5CQH0_9ASTR